MSEHVSPRAFVPCAGRFRTDAGGVVQQLFDGHLGLAGIAQRLRPGNEVERGIIDEEGTFLIFLLVRLGSKPKQDGKLYDACQTTAKEFATSERAGTKYS